jgi:hypothetical protein
MYMSFIFADVRTQCRYCFLACQATSVVYSLYKHRLMNGYSLDHQPAQPEHPLRGALPLATLL